MLVKYHGGLCVFGKGQRSEQAVLPLLPPVSISMLTLGVADPCVLCELTQLIGAEYIVVNETADSAQRGNWFLNTGVGSLQMEHRGFVG